MVYIVIKLCVVLAMVYRTIMSNEVNMEKKIRKINSFNSFKLLSKT